ncbi:MAG: hypothetical protein V2B19_07690 [Pseudomonadota bacterium]
MNTAMDEWGQDPTVQRVRSLFALMEKEQNRLLKELHLPASDMRLRHCRETALGMYERACGLAAARRLAWDENTYAAIYIGCLLREMEKRGIPIPDGVLATHQRHTDLLREVLP